ncbi:MAG TPA: GNAT family N-acetyltransferase [Acidimicrobiales bacterium]|nr:GNAT family N-acetyltransferase [Acidimicrobiales bacterium]
MLHRTRGLSLATLDQIAALEVETVAADGGRLKLEWSVLASRAGDTVDDVLWWEDGRLVGFLGLYAFGGPTVELAGMVHPEYRRRGIGTRLLDEAVDLCRERRHHKALLVVPRNSAGGSVLAARRHGSLDHSEHALDLDGTAVEGPSDDSITLRPVSRDDNDDEARILAEAFGDPPHPRPLDALDDSRLVAELDGRIIATLRLQRTPDVWGIYGFAVEPAHRGVGVGRDLLRRVCRQAHAAGVRRLHLEVEVNNDRALGLYTSLGFTRTSTEDYFNIPL